MHKDEEEILLKAMLPEGYSYKFLKYELQPNNLQEIKFSLETRVNVSQQTSVKQFLSAQAALSTYRQADQTTTRRAPEPNAVALENVL